MKKVNIIEGDTFIKKEDISNLKILKLFNKYPNFKRVELIYYPIWIVYIEGLASRKPFKPKRLEFAGFIDPIIKKSGLIDSIPHISKLEVDDENLITSNYREYNEEIRKLETKILKEDIRKLFALKIPELTIKQRMLCYLPCWKCNISCSNDNEAIVINCINGIREYSFEDGLKVLDSIA